MKLVTIKDFEGKNFLSVILGIFIKVDRNKKGETVKKFSQFMGLGDSYFRMIESGSANLHPSKAILFYQLFGDTAILSLDKISKYLIAIQVIEVQGNSNDSLKNKWDLLSGVHDQDFDLLRKGYDELISENSNENDWHMLMLNYFNEFRDSSSPERQNHFLRERLDKLPSIYFDVVSNNIDELLYLPITMGNRAVWQWEGRNASFFKEQLCLTSDPESICSLTNLRVYKYWHLWTENFSSLKMIVISDDVTSEQIKYEFRKNLKQVLIESDESVMLAGFEDAVGKIIFKTISSRYKNKEIRELLEYKVSNLGYYGVDLRELKFDAVWIWTLEKRMQSGTPYLYNVGFLADIIYENESDKLSEVFISLDFNKIVSVSTKLLEIWNS